MSIITKQNDFVLVICILQIFFWKSSVIIRRMETCIAPLSSAAKLGVPELINSGIFIQKSAAYFNYLNVLRGKKASRKNFIAFFSKYAVINIFSHALADTGDTIPILYLQDSVIKLSELALK